MKDEDLIFELKKGNTVVLKECYNYLQVVKTHVLKNSGNEEEAHDLFQDGMMIFYHNVINDKFKHTSSINTYLFAICKNLWFQRLRKKKVTLEHTDMSDLEQLDLEDHVLDEHNDEMLDRIIEMINEMGDPCKSVLSMYYFRKMSMKNIAIAMKYSNERVAKVRKFKCLKRLKEQLEHLIGK